MPSRTSYADPLDRVLYRGPRLDLMRCKRLLPRIENMESIVGFTDAGNLLVSGDNRPSKSYDCIRIEFQHLG